MGGRKWKTQDEIPAFINSGNQKSTGAMKRNKREEWIWEYGRRKENEINILAFGVINFEILLIPRW